MRRHRIFWIGLALIQLGVCGPTESRAAGGFYFGVGGTYALSQIDTDNLSGTEVADVEIEFGDTAGINARFGWRLLDLVGLELNLDYLPGMESDELLRILDAPAGVTADLDVFTLMLDVKLSPLGVGPLDLFAFGGLGVMNAEVTAGTSVPVVDAVVALSASDTLACGELGLGLGVSFADLAVLNVEASYVAGFGEFGRYNYAIGYVQVTAGVDFYF